VTAAELRRVAQRILAAEGVALEIEAEVVLADADTVRELNRLYRGRDEPTDVLSFPAQPEPVEGRAEAVAFVESPAEAPSLGEVIVCLPVAEASVRGSTTLTADGAIAHLLVHGLLHLIGLDHEEEADSAAMQAREDELLDGLGYAGRYAHGH
jgi:probable rRNA maturation factor